MKKASVGAIVLAAGLGTRMKSAQAKVLHRLGGKPLIAYPLAALRKIGVDPIVVVVGYQAEPVQAACAPFGVRFAVQEEQRGTGHAARMAAPALRGFDGDLLVIYGDLPFLRPDTFRALIRAHKRSQAVVSLLTETVDDPSSFGRIVRDAQRRVVGIVEEKDCSPEQRAIREINVGVYCVQSGFLFEALKKLKTANAQGEYYLTDIIESARRRKLPIAAAAATAGEGAQISSRRDLAALEQIQRERINAHWMAEGVTLEDPATTYIGPDVEIGQDTVIGPGVILRGRTRIGKGCGFDGNDFITDCEIGDGAHVKLSVVMSESEVGRDALVGPFANIRPGTKLGDRVCIGDFVETKKAILGAGTKASHLAYLGDTEIGAGTNIGAGTITCNYDGFNKNKTIIGARVQVGSDSQLVAPVTIGDDAYIATGTTVRADVPAGALVFNVKRELVREGWVAARRARAGRTAAEAGAKAEAKAKV